jgi:hypothetical protein
MQFPLQFYFPAYITNSITFSLLHLACPFFYFEHSHRIRRFNGEPRTGLREPVHGTFSNRFVEIRVEFAANQVPNSQ